MSSDLMHPKNELIKIPIGKFSQISHLSQRALRIYDEKGILIPQIRDELTGYRYYSTSQIADAIQIRLLVSLGFGIQEMEQILKWKGQEPLKLNQIFNKKLIETQLEIQRLKKVEEILIQNRNPINILQMNTTEPQIKEIPKIRVICRRQIGEYSIVKDLVENLIQEILHPDNQRNFVTINGPVIYMNHEKEFKENQADIEIAIPITGNIMIHTDSIELKNLTEGKIVCCLYTGPYEEIPDVYARAHLYVYENGYEIRDITRELYLNNPMETKPEELLTEIQIPIK